MTEAPMIGGSSVALVGKNRRGTSKEFSSIFIAPKWKGISLRAYLVDSILLNIKIESARWSNCVLLATAQCKQ